MDEQVRRLRAAVAALGPRKRGRRIPSSVHTLAVAYAKRGRAFGRSWKAMSREVGLSSESLRRWTEAAAAREHSEGVSVVPVTVRRLAHGQAEATAHGGAEGLVPATREVSPAIGGDSPLVLVSPHGYRLEGLGLGEARLLLEALS